jgi:hypothetical protein
MVLPLSVSILANAVAQLPLPMIPNCIAREFLVFSFLGGAQIELFDPVS